MAAQAFEMEKKKNIRPMDVLLLVVVALAFWEHHHI
jgi:hypothetical protein